MESVGLPDPEITVGIKADRGSTHEFRSEGVQHVPPLSGSDHRITRILQNNGGSAPVTIKYPHLVPGREYAPDERTPRVPFQSEEILTHVPEQDPVARVIIGDPIKAQNTSFDRCKNLPPVFLPTVQTARCVDIGCAGSRRIDAEIDVGNTPGRRVIKRGWELSHGTILQQIQSILALYKKPTLPQRGHTIDRQRSLPEGERDGMVSIMIDTVQKRRDDEKDTLRISCHESAVQ
jgi:hypothetical protein